MSHFAQATIPPAEDTPRHLIEALERSRHIEECGRTVERHARTDGNEELVAEMQRRAMETRRLRSEVLLSIHAHRRAQAPPRNHALPRPRPRQHRAAATRRRRLSRTSSRSADPGDGDDGDGEPARRPPTRRDEPRHISHALRAVLEDLAPRDLHLVDCWWGSTSRLIDILEWSAFPLERLAEGVLTHCPACVRGPLFVTEPRADHAELTCGHGCPEAAIRVKLKDIEALAFESLDGEVAR